MTTDGGGYTYYPCSNTSACPSMLKTTDANGCTALNLAMVIPRTQNHWSSILSFVTTTLNSSSPLNYIAVIPGVTKATDGANPCTGTIMNYDNCQSACFISFDPISDGEPRVQISGFESS